MHGINPIDPGQKIDWGKASVDYATYRPGPPPSFFERLRVLGVGLPQQRILDLGTGTGVLARQFSQQGAKVSASDISEGQVTEAAKLAQEEGLLINWYVSPAESSPFPDNSFDVITANQCWLYFDLEKTIPEVKRLLAPGGLLVTSHFSWMPLEDKTAQKTEELILQYNPHWTASGWMGKIPPMPAWAKPPFQLKAMFYYDEEIPFSRESWRGRIRASRGIGASLSPGEVERFDQDHQKLLEKITHGENFTILHRLDAHFLTI